MNKQIIAVYYSGHKVSLGHVVVNVETFYSDYSRAVEPLDPRYDLRDHSQNGFEWGYHGSGPSQLAIALCAHVLTVWGGQSNGDEIATKVYHDISRRIVSRITDAHFLLLPEDILYEINAVLRQKNEKVVVNERARTG